MSILNNTVINGKLYVNGNINASTITATTIIGALSGNATSATTAANATSLNSKAEAALSVSYATTAGSAGSATYASRVVTTANSSNTSYYIPFTAASTSDTDGASLLVGNSKAFTFNPSTGVVVATTFSGAFSGNASSATYASRIITTANSSNTAYYIPFTAASTSDTDGASLLVGNSKAFTFNPSTGVVVATTFSGTFSGNATSATSATSTGYAGKITTAAKTDNVNYYIPFVSGSTAATSTSVYVGSSQAFTFNASTGVVRATKFSVAGSANLQYNSTSDCLEVVFL